MNAHRRTIRAARMRGNNNKLDSLEKTNTNVIDRVSHHERRDFIREVNSVFDKHARAIKGNIGDLWESTRNCSRD